MPPDRVATVQDGDEVVNAAHRGVAAVSGEPAVLYLGGVQRCHLDESGPLQEQLPRRGVEGTAVDQVEGGGLPGLTGAGQLRDDDERRPVRQGAPALGQERQQRVQREPVDHPAQHDAAERAGLASRQVLRGLADGDRAAALDGAQRDRAARLDPVGRRAPSRERLEERTLPAVGVDDVTPRGAGEHVGRHRAHPRAEFARRDEPGRAVHRPVLGGEPRLERGDPGRQEAERLDDVAHRLLELRLLVLGGPLAAPSRRTQPVQAPRPTPAGTPLGLEGVRQRRRTGVIRPVAIAQMRERGQEVPRVAPLGCQPHERLVQRLCRPGLVRRRGELPPPRPGSRLPRDRHRRLGEELRARRSMLPAMPVVVRRRLSTPGHERVPSES